MVSLLVFTLVTTACPSSILTHLTFKLLLNLILRSYIISISVS
jgi:hypothetical protein